MSEDLPDARESTISLIHRGLRRGPAKQGRDQGANRPDMSLSQCEFGVNERLRARAGVGQRSPGPARLEHAAVRKSRASRRWDLDVPGWDCADAPGGVGYLCGVQRAWSDQSARRSIRYFLMRRPNTRRSCLASRAHRVTLPWCLRSSASHVRALERCERAGAGLAKPSARRLALGRTFGRQRQVMRPDDRLLTEHHRALDHIRELADVSGPRGARQPADRFGCERLGLDPGLGAEPFDEVPRQARDVPGSISPAAAT